MTLDPSTQEFSAAHVSSVDRSPRPASGALTKTGGFLAGFTHTLQPYIGCRFGCEYCYVKGLSVHRFHQPPLHWGDYVHPRIGIAERLRKELTRLAARNELDKLAIFMSSATDPYQGAERQWRLSRACLDVFQEFSPGLLVIQTRSPLVRDDFARIRALVERCWLNLTLETDLEQARQIMTPQCPSVARRLATIQAANEFGLQVQITVSPCLPYSSVETFGELLLAQHCRVIVDSYVSGDGQAGKRTAATATGARYVEQAWGDWRSEERARTLYDWLKIRLGERVGWSQAGFTALTQRAFSGSVATTAQGE